MEKIDGGGELRTQNPEPKHKVIDEGDLLNVRTQNNNIEPACRQAGKEQGIKNPSVAGQASN